MWDIENVYFLTPQKKLFHKPWSLMELLWYIETTTIYALPSIAVNNGTERERYNLECMYDRVQSQSVSKPLHSVYFSSVSIATVPILFITSLIRVDTIVYGYAKEYHG